MGSVSSVALRAPPCLCAVSAATPHESSPLRPQVLPVRSVHACVHACMCPCVDSFMRACICPSIYWSVNLSVCMSVCMSVRSSVHACMRVCARLCMHACMCVHMPWICHLRMLLPLFDSLKLLYQLPVRVPVDACLHGSYTDACVFSCMHPPMRTSNRARPCIPV